MTNNILNADTFALYLNTIFTIYTNEGERFAKLIHVDADKELKKLGRNQYYSRFSIEFYVESEKKEVMQQAIYEFSHPEMGEFSIFIVPIEEDEKGVYYQSVFNYKVEKYN